MAASSKFNMSSGSLDRPLYASGQRGSYSDHKFNRSMDFKRLAGVALGVPPDNSPSSSSKNKLGSSLLEEVKRFKLGAQQKERVKIFNEGLSVFNKCFPGMPSRKRSRSDVLSGDRSSVLFSSDRSVIGPTVVLVVLLKFDDVVLKPLEMLLESNPEFLTHPWHPMFFVKDRLLIRKCEGLWNL
ncbi:hypothetical protein POM88_001667 [Heracleum sosnowskyi]|uniref:Uncharacterized protein n=1 Tax=Heracleum sosnowskyi TaxID=360622 RepID=A0AAD8NAM2_9APIA|nr:hypothetical protein POM88_001667 [Heracleum sosnowskyi]